MDPIDSGISSEVCGDAEENKSGKETIEIAKLAFQNSPLKDEFQENANGFWKGTLKKQRRFDFYLLTQNQNQANPDAYVKIRSELNTKSCKISKMSTPRNTEIAEIDDSSRECNTIEALRCEISNTHGFTDAPKLEKKNNPKV